MRKFLYSTFLRRDANVCTTFYVKWWHVAKYISDITYYSSYIKKSDSKFYIFELIHDSSKLHAQEMKVACTKQNKYTYTSSSWKT